jgi:protocatechuate 3,4-dioxygenase beta subunit
VALASAATAQPIAVHGRVEDDAKRPIAGATARLYPLLGLRDTAEMHLAGTYPPPPEVEAKSAGDGSFTLDAPRPGHWRVVVDAPGRAARQTTLEPLVEETWLRAAELPAEAQLEVRVVSQGGSPVAGALVTAVLGMEQGGFPGSWRAPVALLRTGPDGRTAVRRASADRFDITVVAPGFAVAERREVADSTESVELREGPRRAVLVESAAGKPEPGVLVLDSEHHLPLGRTGPGGRLVVTLPPGEPSSLRLAGAGGASAVAIVEAQPAGARPAPVVARLAPPAPVTGRVIDAERRRPLAGALVWLAGQQEEAATTDSQGGYRLARDAASRGTAWLRAASGGFFPGEARLPETDSLAPTLALDPAGILFGSVTDAKGRPIAGVEITSAPIRAGMRMPRRMGFPLPAPRATSDERGRFRLVALDPRTRHGLLFRRAGYAPLRREIAVTAARPEQLDVVLAAGSALHGLVVDGRGEPVSGAELSLRRQEERGSEGMIVMFGDQEPDAADAEVESDGSGRFAFANLVPGDYVLSASATGFAETTLPGIEVPDGASPVDVGKVEMAPGVAITGRVVDGRGQPLAGAEVHALVGEEGAFPMLRWTLADREAEASTGADGAFALADHRAGDRVTVAARRAGYTSASAAGVVAPNEEPVVITLRDASDIRGRVVDGRDEPVVGARVGARVERSGGGMSFSGTLGMAPTGPDGRFELEDVEPGMIRLTVDAAGYIQLVRGGVEVSAGRDVENVELVLQRGAVVEGVVTGPDGSTVIGARVAVVPEGQPVGMMRVWFSGVASDGDGRYRLAGVEPGRRTIAAQLEGFDRAVAEIEVVSGENRLDLRLGAGQQVSGRVTGSRGEPLPHASVRLAPPGERWWARHTPPPTRQGRSRSRGCRTARTRPSRRTRSMPRARPPWRWPQRRLPAWSSR